MSGCCDNDAKNLQNLAINQKKTLLIVLAINLIMFVAEFYYGIVSESSALTADSLDMLGDAFVYGISIYVVSMGMRAKVRSSQIKVGLMILFGLGVLGRAVYRIFYQVTPDHNIMFYIGMLALCANLVCLALLLKHKNDDINFKSVWLCSRNDIIANTAVLISSGLVFLTESPVSDLVVGVAIAGLFIKSGITIQLESRLILNTQLCDK